MGPFPGGIFVRHGSKLNSPKYDDRLTTGSIIEEVETEGDRLSYRLVTGLGPPKGWVSMSLSGKELVVKVKAQRHVRFWALSDLHADHSANMRWIKGLSAAEYANDVLLLAGDLGNSMVVMRDCLQELKRIFARVFFVPGNHDVWLESTGNYSDSGAKLQALLQACDELGVETRSAKH